MAKKKHPTGKHTWLITFWNGEKYLVWGDRFEYHNGDITIHSPRDIDVVFSASRNAWLTCWACDTKGELMSGIKAPDDVNEVTDAIRMEHSEPAVMDFGEENPAPDVNWEWEWPNAVKEDDSSDDV